MAVNVSSRSLLNTITQNELGLHRNNLYKEKIIATQINRIPHEPRRINEAMSKICNFKHVRANSEGDLLVTSFSAGYFIKRKITSRIYVMKFSFTPVCGTEPNKKNSLISSLYLTKMWRDTIRVSDTVDVHINGKNPILFSGITFLDGIAGLTYFNCDGKHYDYEWRVQGRALCCTACNFSQQFALGCEEGYYLFNTVRMGEKCVLNHENVVSLQFSNDGNFLILCTDGSGITIRDVREHDCYRRYCSIKKEYGSSCRKRYPVNSNQRFIQEIKLLSDQISLITKDYEGHLEKVDLRMMRTVMQYNGHIGHKYRRNICLNEDLDLICTPGEDKVIRIWSLGSGRLNYEKKVYNNPYCIMNDEPPHCCFLSDQRRWFLSVIQDDVIVAVAPTDEFPDLSECDRAAYLLDRFQM